MAADQPRRETAGAIELRVLCWNVFHGRDAPPDPALHTLRSRLLKITEDNGVYLQLNRPLEPEFASVVAGADWSVCLLQEAPPRWADPLARQSGAQAFRVLTSRNQLGSLRRRIARWNPDLVGASEGGSNLTLVRPPWRLVEGGQRSLLLNPFPGRGLRERRMMGFARLRAGSVELCVANLHATNDAPHLAERELALAAETAVGWAGEAPLVLAGDFNLRPRATSAFEEMERRFGLKQPTGPDAIDHILARGLEILSPPAPWAPERRELEVPFKGARRRLRLSDHAPVEAQFRLPADSMRY